MKFEKRKKDFKLREDIVSEFEAYAPSGKQTLIVEKLMADWVKLQKREIQEQETRMAYEKLYGKQNGTVKASRKGK